MDCILHFTKHFHTHLDNLILRVNRSSPHTDPHRTAEAGGWGPPGSGRARLEPYIYRTSFNTPRCLSTTHLLALTVYYLSQSTWEVVWRATGWMRNTEWGHQELTEALGTRHHPALGRAPHKGSQQAGSSGRFSQQQRTSTELPP